MTSQHRGPASRAAGIAGLLALAAAGCAAPPPIFPPVEPPLVWPQAGDPARFAWVGKLEGEADLHRPTGFFKKVANLIGGSEPTVKFQSPYEVAVAGGRIVYISDPDLHAVHRLDLETREYRPLTRAGKDAAGKDLPFASPIGLAFSGERLLVADRGLASVTVLSATGEPEATIGAGVLQAPVGVAVGPETGRIYVADVGSHQVRAFLPDGRPAMTLGARGARPGQFNFPTHVACDRDETIYVTDALNFRVQAFDRDGKFLRTWGNLGDAPGTFSQPKGIAVDPGGRIYVVDSRFENVQVFDREGRLLLAIGEEGNGPGQFWLPVGICADGSGRIWVGDVFNRRVQVFRYLGDAAVGAQP